MDDLDAEYPYKHEKIARSDPEEGIRTVQYGSIANLGSAKKFPNLDSRIRIRLHSHLVWYDSRIQTTSGSGIICIFCLMNFFTDPDPRIRIRVLVTPNSFRKNLNMIFLEEKSGSAPTFEWIHSYFYILAFFKMRYPV